MGGIQSRAALLRRLPLSIAATVAVVGLPVLVLAPARSGSAVSVVLLVVAGAVLSIAASTVGAAAWAAWTGSTDTLFADLMLWGWLRRWRSERQLERAARLLGLKSDGSRERGAALGRGRQARLLKQLAAGLEARHPSMRGHSRRVARHAAAIARRMGLPREQVARIRTAAAVHDIGKVGVPPALIDKVGALSEAELAKVREHAALGAHMAAELGDEELARIVRHHHERVDGRGYPDELAGEDIPLGARIVAVADTFDAVTSSRPYRSGRRHKEALVLLGAAAGTQLDAAAVRAFRGHYSGRRPVALSALLLNGARQLTASLAREARLGGLATAATLAAAGAGSVAVVHLPHVGRHAHSVSGHPGAASGPIAAVQPGAGEAPPRRSGGASNSPAARRHAAAALGGGHAVRLVRLARHGTGAALGGAAPSGGGGGSGGGESGGGGSTLNRVTSAVRQTSESASGAAAGAVHAASGAARSVPGRSVTGKPVHGTGAVAKPVHGKAGAGAVHGKAAAAKGIARHATSSLPPAARANLEAPRGPSAHLP